MKKDTGKILAIVARYAVLIACVVIVLILVQVFMGNRKVVTYTPVEPLVVIAQPERGTLQKSVSFPAYIQAQNLVYVVPLVAGTVEEYPVQVGQQVEQGEVIARIDNEPFLQQLKQAEAAYLGSESTFTRIEALYKNKATTEQTYDQARAGRDAAKAQYELARMQLGYATVTAPVSGTILDKTTTVGSLVGNQSPLAVLADLSTLVVKVQIPESYYPLFWANREQLKVFLSHPNWSEPIAAEVLTLDPYIQSTSKVFSLECLLSPSAELVRPGMSVSVTIMYEQEDDIPLLPQSIRKSDGSWYLYNADTHQVQYVSEPVLFENDAFFKVPKAYENRYFVIDGQNSLFDNQKVRLEGAGK